MNYYKEIKEQIINNEITKKVKDYSKNRSDLTTYYNVGKLLSDAGKHYGEGVIKEYSKKLTLEFGKGYSERNLRNIRQFYSIFSKWQTVSAKLTWSHYCLLLWFENKKMNYYLRLTEEQNLSVRELRTRIKNNEYERLPEETKDKLVSNTAPKVQDFILFFQIVRQCRINYHIHKSQLFVNDWSKIALGEKVATLSPQLTW